MARAAMQTAPDEFAPIPDPPAQAQPGLSAMPAPIDRAGGIALWLRDLVVSAVASILIITFLYQPVRVEGTSMLPRLEDRDRLRIDHGQVWLNGRQLPEPYVPEEYSDSRSMAETVIPEGTYFMMGDHRSISSDSREFGPVVRSLIYGKAVFVYWPTRDAGVVR